MTKLGVIADDFTGATDIAGFLALHGIKTVLTNGIPSLTIAENVESIVVSLKTRSCPKELAVAESLKALQWLQSQGCTQFYFKYCSTFDSTAEGNIGPVTDALMEALATSMTVICPALPVNGRTVYKGYLFVNNDLLNESGMRNHPVTPMLDARVSRLMQRQAEGKVAEIYVDRIDQGPSHIVSALKDAQEQGFKYAVVDTLEQKHLDFIATAIQSLPLVTGGSGLAASMAQLANKSAEEIAQATAIGTPQKTRGIILSGSCSLTTNIQVEEYKKIAPSLAFDIEKDLHDSEQYIQDVMIWVNTHISNKLVPMIYATKSPEMVEALRARYPNVDIGQRVESFFGKISVELVASNVRNFIIAGGETSGVVAQNLGIEAFQIGPQIDPGVPWVKAVGEEVFLALKSGNFGSEDFFRKAQTVISE